ncbi:glycosyltransferase family 2 protein [Thiohalocapsa sp. ML1]|uniref:glycosyltransferase family 2 protein n=1 Tax=Thiohalocapsa sp. ML1 TaxID=1431688 RepID=UPI0009E74094|nr:glycosyltransferase family 2 protein [Thiohalocapsa sp. ML1]
MDYPASIAPVSPQLRGEPGRGLDVVPVVELSLVVPVLNERDTVGLFLDCIGGIFDKDPSVQLEIVFVNDGSTDGTLEFLCNRQRIDERVKVVDLSRNFGKEAALTAGLDIARGRVIVPIDADLQDPPELILEMIGLWRQGYDVVQARRIDRRADSLPKRLSSSWFYRLHNWIAEPKLPENVGDFRLIDRAVVEALKTLPESRRFMKGLFAWVGFRTAVVDYVRPPRAAGSSKFNGWRLWNFALEGLTSFSTAPLRVWTYLGGLVAGLSFLHGLFILIRVFVYGVDTPGFASLFVAMTFLGGLQLIGIGVLGEYLGRAYLETKRRPIYIVRRVYEHKN